MSHYKSNVRDIEFNLYEVLGTDQRLGRGPFKDMDMETARNVLREEAEQIGFAGVMSGPLVRSSYRAGRLYQQALAARG